MRKVMEKQSKLGSVDIADIKFDLRSRDEIPKLLMGLHYIYCDLSIREPIFKILETIVPENINPDTGRNGMDLWKILVLGTLRLNCNWDYDKVQEMANNHKTLRLMLGHGTFDEDYYYALQTIRDNVSLFRPEIMDKISQIVVKAGHKVLGKKKTILKGKCDSFVVKTNVHYPTDINLLLDAIRKVITLTARLSFQAGSLGWRQSQHIFKKIKQLYRKAQTIKKTSMKNNEKKKKLVIRAHRSYIRVVSFFLKRAEETIAKLTCIDPMIILKVLEIEGYIGHAKRQIDQIERRVIHAQIIPHSEKVFSIFETHTEWISKGKAGVPQELGLRVCVFEDNFGFFLHHQVMQKETDEKIAVSMTQAAKNKFPELESASFDRGFYSPRNKKELKKILNFVVMPKKGKKSLVDQEEENSQEFIKGRRSHPAVESAISALENHGLDRCLDHGINNFRRYVALAVLARNIQILGHLVQQKELEALQRQEKLKRQKRTAA